VRIIFVYLIFIIMTVFSGELLAEEKYVIVGQENYAPFNMQDKNGELSGIDIEIITRAAEIAGVKLSITLLPWARALKMAVIGEADGIFGCGRKPEREKVLHYPETPVRNVEIGFFVNKHFKGEIKSLGRLKGQSIGVVVNYFASKEFNDDNTILKEHAANATVLFKKLMHNRNQVAIYSKMAGIYKLKKLGFKNFRYFRYIDAPLYPSYFAFSKKSPNGKKLFKKLSPALKKLKETGEIDEIYKKYKEMNY